MKKGMGMLVIKKIVSLILAITVVLSGISVFASDTVSEKDSVARNVVVGLGFMNAGEDFNAEVSRAAFSTIAIKLYGEETVSELEEGRKTPYLDVNEDYYKSGDIAKAYDLGIIRGYSNGMYYPENSLKVSEAVKIIVDVLGYGEYVSLKGGYAAGYMAEAGKLGITSGVSKKAEEAITYGELARLIYNAMDVSLIEISSLDNSNVLFDKDEEETFLSKYHNIYAGEGVVSATGVTKINGASDINKNQIKIGEELFVTTSSAYDELLGLNCEYYYEDDGSGDNILRYAIGIDNDILEFYGRDIVTAENGAIEVADEEGEIETYDLADNGNVIYNGVFHSKVINYEELGKLAELVDLNGTVRLVDSDNNGDYDVLFVTEYTGYVIDRSMTEDKKLVFKNLDGDASNDIIEVTSNTFATFIKGGIEIGLADVAGGEFASVALSDNFFSETGRRAVKVIMPEKSLTANITSMADNEVTLSWTEGKSSYTETYTVSDNLIGADGAILTVRGSGTFHFDALGEIAYYQASTVGGMQYGYIVGAGSEGRGFSSDYKIKMFTTSGEMVLFYAADKVMVDGARVAKDEIHDILLGSTNSSDGTIKQMVRYKVNESGFISDLDTLFPNVDGDPDELKEVRVVAAGVHYWQYQKMFIESGTGKRYIIPTATMVFKIPVGSDVLDEEYKIASASAFTNDTQYGTGVEQIVMYNVTNAAPDVIEYRSALATTAMSGISTTDGELSIVMDKYDAINDKGEERTVLKIRQKTSNITLYINPETTKLFCYDTDTYDITGYSDVANQIEMTPDDLDFGDIILYSVDNKGDVASLLRVNNWNVAECTEQGEVVTDGSGNPVLDEEGNTVYKNKYIREGGGSYFERLTCSLRKYVGGKQILVDYDDDDDLSNDMWINGVHGTVQLYLVDTKAKTITQGSYADFIASEDDTVADKLFIRLRRNWVRQVVCYR